MNWVWTLLFTTLSTVAFAAQPVQTVVDYLRSTPAWVDGTIRFEREAQVHSSATSSVKLLANRNIGYSFGENFLELSPSHGVELKVLGMINVKVNSIRWDRNRGFTVETELPVDLFGMGRNYINSEVQKELQKMFGAKMQAASNQLRQLRASKRLSDVNSVIQNIVQVFNTGGSGPALPPVRGEMGLVFAPDRDKVLQLNDMRVAIKRDDRIRAAIGFRLSPQGFRPLSLNVTSQKGIDVNEGTEFRQNARLVFSSLDLSGQGMNIGAHLGASETILGLLVAFEVAATQAGRAPTQTCMSCLELVQLRPIQMTVEAEIRREVLELIRNQRPSLRAMGVSDRTMQGFERRATCQLNGIQCAQGCIRQHSSTGPQQTCKRRCEERMDDCLQ